jgi:hypothetical protein
VPPLGAAERIDRSLIRRTLVRLENTIENWPTDGWRPTEVFHEYNLALTWGVAGGRFLR